MSALELPSWAAWHCEWPWVFLLLPLPYLAYRYLPAFDAARDALRVPYFARLERMLGEAERVRARSRSRVRLLGLTLLWLAALLACARPVELGAPIVTQRAARDLLLAVDLSGSMAQTDLATPEAPTTSRLDVVKRVVGEFIRARRGDRLGLVVFGDAPFVQVPFTSDTRVVETLLAETDVAMAGPRTALGDAVGLCLRLFEHSRAHSRVAIVLTDGNDTGSSVPPLQAARIAAEQGVTLYVIGVGDPQAAGEESLNEAVLTQLAKLTGGRYLHAGNPSELRAAYAALDRLEPIRQQTSSYQPKRSIAYLPLCAVVLLLAGAALLQPLASRARRIVAAPTTRERRA